MISDATLLLFVSHDDLRPHLLKPFLWNGCTCATNGHEIILVPGEDARYQPFDDTANKIGRIFPPRSEARTLETQALREILAAIPLIPEIVTCPECEGEGSTECPECHQDVNCDPCKGHGTLKPSADNKMVPDDFQPVAIDGAPIAQHLLRDLLAVADELGAKTFERVTAPFPDKANEFLFEGGVRVLLMPKRADEIKYELKSKESVAA
jgi:hypothetical protein